MNLTLTADGVLPYKYADATAWALIVGHDRPPAKLTPVYVRVLAHRAGKLKDEAWEYYKSPAGQGDANARRLWNDLSAISGWLNHALFRQRPWGNVPKPHPDRGRG